MTGSASRLVRRGRVVRGAADATTELRALAAEDAPRALEPRHDPRVQHPDVDEQRLVAATRRAVGPRDLLAADDLSALQTQAAVRVVLVPVIVRTREAGR